MRWFSSASDGSSTAAGHDGNVTIRSFTSPDVLIPTAILTTALVGSSWIYRTRLRKITSTKFIPERFLRRRSLWGRVVHVGDADNFRLYHTPGGILAGWQSLRRIPKTRKEFMEHTIHVRVAGIDAPEAAHFGRPAQPYSAEALDEMKRLVDGKMVRVYLYRRDQYDRVVASAYTRRLRIPGLPRFFMKDVGMEMLKSGAATVYEAKTGAEFGGREDAYRKAEAKAKSSRRGMWGGAGAPGLMGRMKKFFGAKGEDNGHFESPREYKTRMKKLDDA